MAEKDTNGKTRDPRIDQFATWVLMAFTSVALSLGAWFLNGLATEVKALRVDFAQACSRITVLEALKFDDKIHDLDGRVRTLEIRK